MVIIPFDRKFPEGRLPQTHVIFLLWYLKINYSLGDFQVHGLVLLYVNCDHQAHCHLIWLKQATHRAKCIICSKTENHSLIDQRLLLLTSPSVPSQSLISQPHQGHKAPSYMSRLFSPMALNSVRVLVIHSWNKELLYCLWYWTFQSVR